MFDLTRVPYSRLLLVMALLFSLAFVACGSGEETAGDDDTEPAAEEGEEMAAEEGAEEGADTDTEEQVTIRFWMQQDNRLVTAMEGLIESFEEAHPNVDVQLDSFPFSEYHQKISTAFAGNDAPDAFWMDVRTASLAEQGALLPLDEYLTEENRDDYLASTWAEPTYQGATYGVPMHQLTSALYVNADLAEEAGVELPTSVDEAWTWSEFVDVTTALTQRSGDVTDVWGFAVQRQLQDWSVLPVVYQNGGQALSDDLSQATGHLNGPETVEALTWYGELFTEHRVVSVEPIPDGFPTGKVAVFQAPSTYRPVLENDYPDLNYTVVPIYKEDQCGVMTGGWNVSVAATTEHPDETWAFVDWITREGHQEWVEASGYLPARHSVIDAMSDQLETYPWNIFMEQLENCAVTRPAVPEYTFFFDVFKQAITDIAIGEDPQATLDAAATQLDEELGN